MGAVNALMVDDQALGGRGAEVLLARVGRGRGFPVRVVGPAGGAAGAVRFMGGFFGFFSFVFPVPFFIQEFFIDLRVHALDRKLLYDV